MNFHITILHLNEKKVNQVFVRHIICSILKSIGLIFSVSNRIQIWSLQFFQLISCVLISCLKIYSLMLMQGKFEQRILQVDHLDYNTLKICFMRGKDPQFYLIIIGMLYFYVQYHMLRKGFVCLIHQPKYHKSVMSNQRRSASPN